jgi:hypothetical protein
MLYEQTITKMINKALTRGYTSRKAWTVESDYPIGIRIYHFDKLIGGYDPQTETFFSTTKGWSVTDRDNLRKFLYVYSQIEKNTPSLAGVQMYGCSEIPELPSFLKFEAKGEDGLYYIDCKYGFTFPRPESFVVIDCPRMPLKEVNFWGGSTFYPDKKLYTEAYFPQSVLKNPEFIKKVLIQQIKYHMHYDSALYRYLKPEDIDDNFQTSITLLSIRNGREVKTA